MTDTVLVDLLVTGRLAVVHLLADGNTCRRF